MGARKDPPAGPLETAYHRAQGDKVAAVLRVADQAGIRFSVDGRGLTVDGAAALHNGDAVLFAALIPEIEARLAGPENAPAPVKELGVEVEEVVDAGRAREIVAGLPGSVGLDVETCSAAPAEKDDRRRIRLTKQGRPCKAQPSPNGMDGLSPSLGRPRLLSFYNPDAEVVYVIDLFHVPVVVVVVVLEGLRDRTVVAHNAVFECAMLGGWPRKVIDSYQLAGLAYGCAPGRRTLAHVAREALGLELPKEQQKSDWGAPVLSRSQIEYAACDAVVAYRAARVLWAELDAAARRAFEAQNAVVPVFAGMRLRGVPLDAAVHEATVAQWERERARAALEFEELTGAPPPKAGRETVAWLERRLPPEMRRGWKRTKGGLLSTKSADLKRVRHIPEVAALRAVAALDELLEGFGRDLLVRVDPVTGRLHPDWLPCAQKAGRSSCRKPNLMAVPQEVRRAVVAPPGRTFINVDYSQIELRAVAGLAGEEVMRRAFANGDDIHRLTASEIAGADYDAVTGEQRKRAKAVVFGILYGMGPAGLADYARTSFDVEMTREAAASAHRAFLRAYPAIARWQKKMKKRAELPGVLRTSLGRPLRAAWEHGWRRRWVDGEELVEKVPGIIKPTLACNFPVQGSAADVMLLAMARVHEALRGLDAGIILQIHDELVVECAEGVAVEVKEIVTTEMTEAFKELFPNEPTLGLVDADIRPCWAKPEKPKPEVV